MPPGATILTEVNLYRSFSSKFSTNDIPQSPFPTTIIRLFILTLFSSILFLVSINKWKSDTLRSN